LHDRKMAADHKLKLLVKNLPPELGDEDKKDLMKSFGAIDVVCFGKKGRMRNSVFVSFKTHDLASKALKRLHQLEVLGCILKAEYANEPCERLANSLESRKVLERPSNLGSSKRVKNDENESREEEKDELSSGIAPKLGVHHKFPNHLTYLYPTPTVTTLTNIANALASVPRFYTQVLHLMNKMNLPPPFSGPTLTPPLPDDTITLIDSSVDTSDLHLYASSEESELESEAENELAGNLFGEAARSKVEPPRKKRRLRPANISVEKPRKAAKEQQQQQHDIEDAFEQAQQVKLKRIEFKLAANIAATVAHRAAQIYEDKIPAEDNGVNGAVPGASGFGVFEPAKDELGQAADEDFPAAGEEFVSLEEIKKNKLEEADLASLPQMKNYDPGQQSNRLYIKNLAKHAEKEDLEYLFRRFIHNCSEKEKEAFEIRLMKEGRMKGQAFVTFPSSDVAFKALKSLHGYVLHEKPLLIQFGRTAK